MYDHLTDPTEWNNIVDDPQVQSNMEIMRNE